MLNARYLINQGYTQKINLHFFIDSMGFHKVKCRLLNALKLPCRQSIDQMLFISWVLRCFYFIGNNSILIKSNKVYLAF